MSDVVLIMDQYKRFEQAESQRQKIDSAYEANKLSELSNAFGGSLRRVAIVNDHDRNGFDAYRQARYEIFSMNGTRPVEIQDFIAHMKDDLERRPPEHLLLVTDDPTFRFLLDPVVRHGETHTKVWVLGKQVQQPFTDKRYHARLYSEIIPEPKVPRVAMLFDYENLHIGLKQRGWQPSAKALIEAARQSVSDLGDVVKMVAYADWKLLEQNDRRDWQRELAGISIDTQYVLNERGKNTADMKIADAVRDLVERNANAPDAVDVIVLGTNDRDFRATVEKARERGQRIVVLAIKGGLSRHLLDLLDPKDIRYIDDHLTMSRDASVLPTPVQTKPNTPHMRLIIQVAAWFHAQPSQQRILVTLGQLATGLSLDSAGINQLRQAARAGLLYLQSRSAAGGSSELIGLNRKSQAAKVAQRLIEWSKRQVEYNLNIKHMPYIDTNYLARGMTMDRQLQELGIGQQRQEAEAWLKLLAETGVLVRQELQHPHTPNKTITTWQLPPKPSKMEPAEATAHESSEYQPGAPTETAPPNTEEAQENHPVLPQSTSTLQSTGWLSIGV